MALTPPTLDAHAHLSLARSPADLSCCGAVLAMTLSLDEASRAVARREPTVVWGVGCHPRKPASYSTFDADRFAELVARSAVVGEIGLDAGSRVPLEVQLLTLRRELNVVSKCPRLVSLHAYGTAGLVVQELRRTPVAFPVLHWWTGSAAETREAVALGCYFSVHSQVARQSKFRTAVPPERVLLETDHGYNDPPAAIPCRLQWVEYLTAQQYGLTVTDIRKLAWRNLATIFNATGTQALLPRPFANLLAQASVDAAEVIQQARLFE